MSQLRAYLQLVRLPAVFTAMADVFLGYLLTHPSLEPPLHFGMLLLASSTLYLAGMAFNDVFDREQDARERPQRPIPSGRVSLFAAIRLGILLMAAGIGAASVVGTWSALVAMSLAACILLYDGPLKSTVLGPVVMGSCRFLNVMLGASAVGTWSKEALCVATAMGVYVAGVTWFARNEAGTSQRWQLVAATVVVNLGLAGVAALILSPLFQQRIDTTSVLVVFGVILLTINRRLSAAIQTGEPPLVQAAVKTMLLSIIVIDAALVLVATGQLPFAIAVVALLIPALFLGRFIWVT